MSDLYFIMSGLEHGLPVGLATAKRENLQLTCEDINLAAHQAMRPIFVDENGPIKESDLSLVARSAQEHNQWLGRRSWQRVGQGPARRSRCNPRRVFGAVGLEKGLRSGGQPQQAGVAPTMPDLELPKVVIALNFCLKAGFTRRSKDRNNSQAKAQMNQAPQAAGLLVRALKTRVVVELGERRAAKSAPVGSEASEGIGGGEGRARPRNRKAATEGNAVEDFDWRKIFDRQTFDKIKGVQLGAALGQIGQVPARRGRPLTLARPSDQAVLGQNSRDRALRGQDRQLLFFKVTKNGGRAELAQRRMFFEPEARRKDALLNSEGSAVFGSGISARGVVPTDAVQPLAFDAVEPFEGCAHADVETNRHSAERSTTSQSSDDERAFKKEFFLVMKQEWGLCQQSHRACLARSASARSARLRCAGEAGAPPPNQCQTVYHLLSLKCLPFPVISPLGLRLGLRGGKGRPN